MPKYQAVSGSAAEDLFIDLFSETFGAEKAGYLYSQYPFFDIYQNSRYYEGRRAAGLVVEKPNSLFARGGYTDKEAERNILANPFKRFEDMQMLRHTRTLGIVQVDESVWKKLTAGEKAEMEKICEEKLEQYFSRLAQ